MISYYYLILKLCHHPKTHQIAHIHSYITLNMVLVCRYYLFLPFLMINYVKSIHARNMVILGQRIALGSTFLFLKKNLPLLIFIWLRSFHLKVLLRNQIYIHFYILYWYGMNITLIDKNNNFKNIYNIRVLKIYL